MTTKRKYVKKTEKEREDILNTGNYAVTKWLDKSDVPWLRAEQARLTKKGWDVTVENNHESYRLFVISKNNTVKEEELPKTKVLVTMHTGSELYELRTWPNSHDVMSDYEWNQVVISNKDLEQPAYIKKVTDYLFTDVQ